MSVTFQPPSRSLTARDYQFIALVVLLFLILSSGLVFANLRLKGGGDFYVHWVGARAFLFDKIDPYGGQVPARVQQLVYGGPLKAAEEPYILTTPFQLLPFYYPFSLFSDPSLARAIFTLMLELALFTLAVLSLRLADSQVPRIFTILFIFLAIFNFYSFQAIYEASPVLILGFLYTGILFTLRMDMDELSGALIAFSLYYWEVGLPFLLLIFLRVTYEKRNRVLLGFFMVCFVLFFVSFLTYPNWIIPFWRAVVNNLHADFGYSLLSIFIHIWPSQGQVIAWIIMIMLFVVLGYELSSARSGDDSRFYWACCLSLAAAPVLGFRTEMEHLVVLIIPLALIFAVVHDRWRLFGDGLTIVLMVVVFVFPWALYFFAFDHFGGIVQDAAFLFLPFSTIIGLYWIRWWAIRPKSLLIDLASRK